MAEEKRSFILYCDLIHTFAGLTNDEAGKLIKHVFSYVNDENPETNDRIIKIAFEPIKQQLKRDLKNWESIKKKRSDAGKASAEARKQKSTSVEIVEQKEQVSTNSTVSVNVNDNVNVIDSQQQNNFPLMTQQDMIAFQGKLIQDFVFIEQLMLSKQIKSKTDMLGWIKYFNIHIIGEEKLNKDFKEYKRHFKNWIVKFDTSKPPPINGTSLSIVPLPQQTSEQMTEKYRRK